MRQLWLTALIAGVLALPGSASAQVVELRGYPGPRLVQGPELAGDRVGWAQMLCTEDCDPVLGDNASERYAVLAAPPDGVHGRLMRARVEQASSGPNFRTDSYRFLFSAKAFATLHFVLRGDEVEGEMGTAVLRAGVLGDPRGVLATCTAELFSGPVALALDGARLAYEPEPCDDTPRFVVRDLATGLTSDVPAAPTGTGLRLRGRFAAWIEGDATVPRLVVYDLVAQARAYSASAAGVVAFDLDEEGSVAAVAAEDPTRPCSTGRLLRHTVAAPEPAEIPAPTCATDVRIESGRIVFVGWEGPARALRLARPDGSIEDLVRFGRVRPAHFDVDEDELAWAARNCSGGESIFRAPLGAAAQSAGAPQCPTRLRSSAVRVRRGLATVRLSCPRGCGGELSLRRAARRRFSLGPGEHELRLRLNTRARKRLERSGSLATIARLAWRNRAGDRLTRSRALTLRTG